jgi:hypothetical protein
LCAKKNELNIGKDVHQFIKEQKLCEISEENGLIISSTLVNMYVKCGSIKEAEAVSFI